MKSIYQMSTGALGLAMLVLVIEYFVFMTNTMGDYYTNKHLELSSSLSHVLTNCTYTGSISVMSASAELTVGSDAIVIGLMHCCQYITTLFILTLLAVLVNTFSMMRYRAGDRHIRVLGVHASVYHGLVVAAYGLNIAIIGATFGFDSSRKFYLDAVDHCASLSKANDEEAFYASEFAGYTVLSTAVYWPMSAACLSLVIFLIGLVVRCINSYHRADILLSEADAPWEERGVLCGTSKPLLRLHTTQRAAIIEEATAAMNDGMKVRIARTYQLLTEDVYNQVLQAMEKLVKEDTAEEQVDLMDQNCGGDVSVLHRPGFTWRESIPWKAPASPAEEDEELSVEVTGDTDLHGTVRTTWVDGHHDDNIEDEEESEEAEQEWIQEGEEQEEEDEPLADIEDDALFSPDEMQGANRSRRRRRHRTSHRSSQMEGDEFVPQSFHQNSVRRRRHRRTYDNATADGFEGLPY